MSQMVFRSLNLSYQASRRDYGAYVSTWISLFTFRVDIVWHTDSLPQKKYPQAVLNKL